jgi:hypothetical protein
MEKEWRFPVFFFLFSFSVFFFLLLAIWTWSFKPPAGIIVLAPPYLTGKL